MSAPDQALAVSTEPEVVALRTQATDIERRAAALDVTDVQSHETALWIEKEAKAGEKAVHDKLDPLCEAAYTAHKRTVAFRSEMLSPYLAAGKLAGGKAGAFEREQRAKAEIEERRLQEIARKDAEERLLQDALAAEAEGSTEEAEAILAEPVQAPVVRVVPAVAIVPGKSSATLYSAEVVDVWALVGWVFMDPTKSRLPYLENLKLTESHPNLNKLAQMQREAFAVPGCKLVKTDSRRTKV